MDAAKEVIQLAEANYPDHLRRIFIINGLATIAQSISLRN